MLGRGKGKTQVRKETLTHRWHMWLPTVTRSAGIIHLQGPVLKFASVKMPHQRSTGLGVSVVKSPDVVE